VPVEELLPAVPVVKEALSPPAPEPKCEPSSLLLAAALSEVDELEQAIGKRAPRSAKAPNVEKLRKCAIDFTLPAHKARCVPPPMAAEISVRARSVRDTAGTHWHSSGSIPQWPILHRVRQLFEKCRVPSALPA
jgi:hypothetical protein